MGWILWFAYIVAAVLYALGFSAFSILAVGYLDSLGDGAPDFVRGRSFSLLLAVGATLAYALSLARQASRRTARNRGEGRALHRPDPRGPGRPARPTPGGDHGRSSPSCLRRTGLLMAMGFTIALQGFDLIPAVGGEIGTGPDHPAVDVPLAGHRPCHLSPAAVRGLHRGDPGRREHRHAGPKRPGHGGSCRITVPGAPGYWLVVIAAILSTLSALNSNLMAASRVALSMARDRNLPLVLGTLHRAPDTCRRRLCLDPRGAHHCLMVPDLASAGAASLIFLLSFASTHPWP